MNIVAIVQVRMGSTRLPKKALKEILGKPMLWHIINRVKNSGLIEDVVIACTNKGEDDAIEDFAKKNSIAYYRGSTDDIVDRFYYAAKIAKADIIIRLWGDCPLIDSKLIEKVLKKFIKNHYDYANNSNPATYPVGMNFEIYTYEALERIWKGTCDPFYREYPFEYVYKHGDLFKTLFDKNKDNLSHIHLTVDYEEDFKIITQIYESLYVKNSNFDLNDILYLIQEKPDMLNSNKNLKRNIEYREQKKTREKDEKHGKTSGTSEKNT